MTGNSRTVYEVVEGNEYINLDHNTGAFQMSGALGGSSIKIKVSFCNLNGADGVENAIERYRKRI